MAKYNNEWEYLVHLLSSVLKGEKPDELPENLSFHSLFSLASFHSVANMAYYGIEQLQTRPDKELTAKWAEVRDKEIMKDITQQMELEQLTAELEKAEVKFILLKGSCLKILYPQSDFRSMADIDFYIDEENNEKVRDVLLSMGYEINSLEHGVHDVYYKKPVMNIEVHKALFGNSGREFSPVFENLWDKCDCVKGTCYNLTPDYFFAYLVAHGIKHYDIGGTGIRSFMDIHVYLNKKAAVTDLKKTAELFSAIGKKEIYEDFLRLSEIWFADGEYTEKYKSMTEFIMKGGTYGTLENQVENGIKRSGRAKFIFIKLFPQLNYMREQYPVLKKAPVLLPFCWVVRWVKAATVNRRQTKIKMNALKNKK